NNANGAQFVATGDGTLQAIPAAVNPLLFNSWYIQKTGGTGVTTLSIPVQHHAGGFDVQIGTVELTGGITLEPDSVLSKLGSGTLVFSSSVAYGNNASIGVFAGLVKHPGTPNLPAAQITPGSGAYPGLAINS